LINRTKLQEGAQTERERRAQRYVDEQTIVAPSVITLNAAGAAQTANDFLFYMAGLARDEASTAYVRLDPRKRSVSLDSPRRSWDCTEMRDRTQEPAGPWRRRQASADVPRRRLVTPSAEDLASGGLRNKGARLSLIEPRALTLEDSKPGS
jgi:hypothetical protein